MGLFQHDLEEHLRPGTKVVVRSERGVELADVLANVTDTEGPGNLTRQQLKDFLQSAGPEYPFYRSGRLLRLANSQDLIDQRHLNNSAREEALYCRKEIRETKLDMKLVTVEHLLGGERIIFYFAAENRVDFRELVRRLAGQFRTRIEMRQVGARDEARLVGDFERCGRPCCCLSFLRDLKPISMRMAKMQKATLDPSKISGRCGRLMCCLRYEDAGYEALRAKLPRKNSIVRTASGVVGKVIDMQILTQLVRLLLPDNSQMVVSNEEITARDVPLPTPGTLPAGAGPAQAPVPWRPSTASPQALQVRGERRETPDALPAETDQAAAEPDESMAPQVADEAAPPSGDSAASQAGPPDPRRHRRRRRRGRRHGDGQPAPAAGGQAQAPLQAQGQPQGQAGSHHEGGGGRRQRRRRRRR
jgi:cell fate regulator YaaT (PSP1 superfamily)